MSLQYVSIEKEYTDEEKAKMRRQSESKALKELTKENRDNLKGSRSRRGFPTSTVFFSCCFLFCVLCFQIILPPSI